jgi:proton-dependent oligopeptide transporter, POT family
VFYVCCGIISLNFLLLLTYREPKKELRLERARVAKEKGTKQESLWRESLRELKKKHVWLYLAIFSGFWFMFNSLFDVLPLHIRDWVNTQTIVTDLFGPNGTSSGVFKFLLGMNEAGTAIQPEGMLNLNAALIMVTCFFFAYVSGLMRATTSMVIGTLMACVAMFLSGFSTLGWLSFAAIMVFSIGEMLSSPKFSEFIGNFAPADKKAMYLGFSQIPLAIGWTLEGKLGPMLYDHYASKERFSRELLLERGMSPADLEKVEPRKAFEALVAFTKETPQALTDQMHATHSVGTVWVIMGIVGILTAVGIYMYGRWIKTLVIRK